MSPEALEIKLIDAMKGPSKSSSEASLGPCIRPFNLVLHMTGRRELSEQEIDTHLLHIQSCAKCARVAEHDVILSGLMKTPKGKALAQNIERRLSQYYRDGDI